MVQSGGERLPCCFASLYYIIMLIPLSFSFTEAITQTAEPEGQTVPPPEVIKADSRIPPVVKTYEINPSVINPSVSQILATLAPLMATIPRGPSAEVESTGVIPTSTGQASSSTQEEGSTSISATALPALNSILENFVSGLIGQFFTNLSGCATLILSGESNFAFVQSLLDSQVDHIGRITGPERAKIY